jgi:inosine-uridine nucleoside N-ribohydrolase
MCIFYALGSPGLEVVGLTTVFGNAHTSVCTTNALKLLEIAGRTDIPVAQGAHAPLTMPYRGPVAFVHGEDGQGNVFLPPPAASPLAIDAANFIIRTVMDAPGEITLVAVGPLTNLAVAMQREPTLSTHVAEIVLMGGNAFVGGNASPAAEANILNDPEAADIVFGADCPIVMAGLDVTEQTIMTSADLTRMATFEIRAHLSAIVPFYQGLPRPVGSTHLRARSSTISYCSPGSTRGSSTRSGSTSATACVRQDPDSRPCQRPRDRMERPAR